jgi:hypothetical protein
MSNKTKKQQWLDYAEAMRAYHEQVLQFAHSLPNEDEVSTEGESTGIENPQPPLPPKPPA